ncbi:MAG: T9SS type A sorting domain-containing protein [Bacteroidetes bacterium]|nr:T9SS type A sorting domain-containing protein [Bacteroidota bacterium]
MKQWISGLVIGYLGLTASAFAAANNPPAFTSPSPVGPVLYSVPFSHAISATDSESDPITFYTLGAEQPDASHQTGYYWATGYQSVIWQSFTTEVTGFLTKAGMQCAGNTSMGRQALTIYAGTGTSGAVLYSDTLDFGPILDYHTISIPVSAGILVESGQVYTIAVTNATGYMIEDLYSNPYPAGQSSWSGSSDFQFITRVQPLNSTTGYSWLNLNDNEDGTGELTGLPLASDAGTVSITLVAFAAGQFATQSVSFTVESPVPAPADLQAAAGNETITLTWDPVTHPMAVRYLLYGGSSPNPTTLIDSIGNLPDTSYTVTGLPNNEIRYFRMRVRDDQGGLSRFSAETYAVPVQEAGLAFNFNGITSISFPRTVQNDFTIEFWMQSTQIAGGTGQWWQAPGLVDAESNSRPDDFGVSFGAGRVVFGVGNGSTDTSIAGPYIADGGWHHVAATRSQSTGVFQLYVDGVLVATGLGGTNTLDASEVIRIGQVNPASHFFNGNMDDIRIWNVVRSESEIREYFGTRLTGKEPGLVTYLNFDEQVGVPVLDYSRQPSTLTVSGNQYKLSSYAMLPFNVRNLAGTPENSVVKLSWSPNREGDIAFYRVARGTVNNYYQSSPLASELTDTVFTDEVGEGDHLFFYWVTATDQSGRDGGFGTSAMVSSVDSAFTSVVSFDGPFLPVGWEIVNPDDSYTWQVVDVNYSGGGEESIQSQDRPDGRSGKGKPGQTPVLLASPSESGAISAVGPNYAARMNFYSYGTIGQADTLKTKLFRVEPKSWLKFDLAYRGYDGSYVDSLKVIVLPDNPAEPKVKLFEKSTFSGLNSIRGQQYSSFVPSYPAAWGERGFDLSAWEGQLIRIAFVSVTGYGNNLYIDNVRVDRGLPTPQTPVTLGSDGQVQVAWSPVTGSNFKQYVVKGAIQGDELVTLGTTPEGNPLDTVFVHTGLENGTIWEYQVAAVNEQDSVGNWSVVKTGIPVTGAGNALSFDGLSTMVSLDNSIQFAGSSFTIEAWVKVYGSFVMRKAVTIGGSVEAGVNNENQWYFYLNGTEILSEVTLEDTLWHHLAVAFNAGTNQMDLYVDGFLAATGMTQSGLNTDSDVYLGDLSGESDYFYGQIDEVRFWNSYRSESEILNNRDVHLDGSHPNLLGMYRFDEPAGSTLYDAVESNFHGLINGNSVFVPSGAFQLPTVPVELISFTHVGHKLIWKTATETTNAGWEVEISKPYPEALEGNGFDISGTDPSRTSGSVTEEWKTIGFVAGAGSSTEERSYSFTLPVVKEAIRVRLKQLDTDGTVSYSQILTIESTPSRFALEQNYPNPFNPTTVISYQLSDNSKVKLQVYDVTGRLVTTLVDGKKDAGFHEVEFNAAGLSSGLYFYRIAAGNFSAVKTMVLVK